MGRGGAAKRAHKTRMPVPEGFAGTSKGSFFEVPSWVDETKLPGQTDQSMSLKDNPKWADLLSGKFLFFSPNLVWLLVALFDYFVFPYDLEAAKEWAVDWVSFRLCVNTGIVFSYFGFWHVTLYVFGWGERPFQLNREYKFWTKVLHNMTYTFLGALQWTVWEAIFLNCYATGRLPYLSDAEAFSTFKGFLNFVACFFWVPLWREFHFYFAHRLIHIKVRRFAASVLTVAIHAIGDASKLPVYAPPPGGSDRRCAA